MKGKKKLEREKKKERENIFFNERRERNLIKYFFCFSSSYSAQPYIVVHCSNEGKIFTFNSTATSLFFMCSVAKKAKRLFLAAPLLQMLLRYLLNFPNF